MGGSLVAESGQRLSVAIHIQDHQLLMSLVDLSCLKAGPFLLQLAMVLRLKLKVPMCPINGRNVSISSFYNAV